MTGAHPYARSLSLELPSPGARLGRGRGLFFVVAKTKHHLVQRRADHHHKQTSHPACFGAGVLLCGGIRRRGYGTELMPFVNACGVAHNCGVCVFLFLFLQLIFLKKKLFLQAETSKKPTAVDTAPRHRVRKTLSAASFFRKSAKFCCD